MYLHAGNNCMIRQKNIIAILDMDNATVAADTKRFLQTAQKEGRLITAQNELPKSMILYENKIRAGAKAKNRRKRDFCVCISQLSSVSLCNRIRKK